jgi:signal transduction histidine kinase
MSNKNNSGLDKIIKQFEKKQVVYSLLGLLILLGTAIIANNLHLQSVAQQSTKYISRMIQLDDFREVGLALEETLMGNFLSIKYQSNRSGRSFSLPASSELTQPTIWKSFSTEQVTVQVINPLQPENPDSITFVYDRFNLTPYALGMWILLLLVSVPQTRHIKKRLIEQFEKDLVLERQLSVERVADEVRHNLRTPLAALLRLPARMPDNLSQDRDLLKTCINQIKKITATLDRKNSGNLKENESTQIYDTLCNVFNQIELTLPANITLHTEVSDSLVSALVPHVPVELQVILGNIVNNSLDAIAEAKGSIKVRAVDMAPDLVIEIEDDGPGISKENLPRLFEKGFTYGKSNGTGLGLHHAKTWITKWGGSIRITSTPFVKTVTTIIIPIAERASWYVPRLKISKNDPIYILDDQLSARQLWHLKLYEYGLAGQAVYLSSADEAKSAILENGGSNERAIYLFDFDLKEKETGLDLLKLLPTSSHRYLVTGHFDKAEIRSACEAIGIYLIPMSEIQELPIIISEN